MRTLFSIAALSLGLAGSSFAAAKPAKAAAKPPSCPVCKMALSTTKTKTNTKAIKVAGKTYYCCPKCDMSKLNTPKKKA